MAEHTPGPWRYEPSRGGYNFRDDEPNGEYIITGSNEHGGHVPIIGRTHNWPRNAEANARLIAAAPELLAALERTANSLALLIREVPDPGTGAFADLRIARDAIRKARGGRHVMAEHTPGPWHVSHHFQDGTYAVTRDGDDKPICDVWTRRYREGTAEGNARLIAAAPELLDGCNALIGLIQIVAGRDDLPPEIRDALTSSHRLEEAKAAIAKAQDDA